MPAYLFVTVFTPVLPFGLGFAAGARIWMTWTELVHDALEEAPRPVVFGTLVGATVVMSVIGLTAMAASRAGPRDAGNPSIGAVRVLKPSRGEGDIILGVGFDGIARHERTTRCRSQGRLH